MYARTCGAKKPMRQPASSGCVKGIGRDRPHMALDSDCFSKARVRTVRWTRDATRLEATRAVEPPTEPAVCTRSIGLPTAPRASARYSSGIMTPSKKSGALPITTASMSAHVNWASSRARCAASRTSPAIETSLRAATCLVWPMPTTATGSLCVAVLLIGRLLPGRRPGSAGGRGRRSRVRGPGRTHRGGYGRRPRRSAADPRP